MEKNISETVQKEVIQYNQAVSVIKCAILKRQARVAQTVVHEQLALYTALVAMCRRTLAMVFGARGLSLLSASSFAMNCQD